MTRTWHVQAGIFWIATAWLAAGLFIGPLISGHEPKYQSLGVHVLFGALLVIVVGSMAGEWLSIHNRLSDANSFLWGHQGYEYVDLGRAWQILLFTGLLIWLGLVVRAVRPAVKTSGEHKPLLWLFMMSAGGDRRVLWRRPRVGSAHPPIDGRILALVGGSSLGRGILRGLRYNRDRVFLHSPGLDPPRVRCQGRSALGDHLSRGRHHRHLPSPVLFGDADGGPCVWLRIQHTRGGAADHGGIFGGRRSTPQPTHSLDSALYRWPVNFFVAVAFWNMIGAGLFGFMINPPIALYFMQGLNTTPLHGHAAPFGVYGMLGIGLMLVCLHALSPETEWKEKWLRFAFWAMNGGLMAMCVGSLLPVGLMQTWASVEHGYRFARSAEFLGSPLMRRLRLMRVPGDTLLLTQAEFMNGPVVDEGARGLGRLQPREIPLRRISFAGISRVRERINRERNPQPARWKLRPRLLRSSTPF